MKVHAPNDPAEAHDQLAAANAALREAEAEFERASDRLQAARGRAEVARKTNAAQQEKARREADVKR